MLGWIEILMGADSKGKDKNAKEDEASAKPGDASTPDASGAKPGEGKRPQDSTK
jgi:hypothetical protein